ncbi:hypothetical protein ABW19_dt0209644 [Dactylella cylindrospora]|nr:hypothetical protein ABW19_dt0209644 [Dactylella cylindrospora]
MISGRGSLKPNTSKLDILDIGSISLKSSGTSSSFQTLLAPRDLDSPLVDGARHKLEVPAPSILKISLDRQSAYHSTRESLERWSEAVKLIRNADQIVFPAKQIPLRPRVSSASQRASSGPTSAHIGSTDFENFESKISGTLASPIVERTNQPSTTALPPTLPREESASASRRRIGLLRMERERLIKEKTKSKRMKRIKSKSYRRVIRKDMEKAKKLSSDLDLSQLDDKDWELAREEPTFQAGNGYDRITEWNSQCPSRHKGNSTNGERKLMTPPGLKDSRAPNNSAGKTGDVAITPLRNLVDDFDAPSTKPNPWLHLELAGNRKDTTPMKDIPTKIGTPETPLSTNSTPLPTTPLPYIPTILRDPGSLTPDSFIIASDRGSKKKPQTSNNLISRAFASDSVMEDFANETSRDSAAPPKGLPDYLPGWGEWNNSRSCNARAYSRSGPEKSLANSTRTTKIHRDKVIVNGKRAKKVLLSH